MNESTQKVALVAITKSGAVKVAAIARQLSTADLFIAEKHVGNVGDVSNCVTAIALPAKDHIGELFAAYDQIVFLVALGGVIRLIAPYLKSKETDPGVIVIDNAAQFVIPVLSGHVGGANEFAVMLADILGSVPVVTTAADVGNTVAVDILGRDLGWRVEARDKSLTRVAAMMVNKEPIAMVQEVGATDWWKKPTPIPENIQLFDAFGEVDLDKYQGVLWVTNQEIPERLWSDLKDRLIIYRTPE
jgi:cobalt-precorrin 5A hydrolase